MGEFVLKGPLKPLAAFNVMREYLIFSRHTVSTHLPEIYGK